jgi:excisionase family DNA binding protein
MNQSTNGNDPVIRSDRPNKLLLTFDEASVALSISRAMLNKLARTGRMRVTRIGRSVRVSQEELLRLCSDGQMPGGGQ